MAAPGTVVSTAFIDASPEYAVNHTIRAGVLNTVDPTLDVAADVLAAIPSGGYLRLGFVLPDLHVTVADVVANGSLTLGDQVVFVQVIDEQGLTTSSEMYAVAFLNAYSPQYLGYHEGNYSLNLTPFNGAIWNGSVDPSLPGFGQYVDADPQLDGFVAAHFQLVTVTEHHFIGGVFVDVDVTERHGPFVAT